MSNKKKKVNCKLVILLLLVSHTCFSQTERSIEKKIDSLFSNYNSETPGVAAMVVRNGKIVFNKSYGLANFEYDIPITSNTVFHIASVSKQFTTFAIYLLEKEGKISLDDNLRKYIPEIPEFDKPITIRHLCSHTSGLRDQWGLLTLAGWRMDDVITTEQVLKLVSHQKESNFTAGSQFMYSNTGFTLLAEIIERISGVSFAEYVSKNIFQPLKMNNSQVYDDHRKIVKNRAYSYGEIQGEYIKSKLNYSIAGATSLFTTTEDLAKWVLNFETLIVGDKELMERYNEISKLDNGEPAILGILQGDTVYHAKGQFLKNYRGLTFYNHTGSDAGFNTYLIRFPKQRLSIILLSNDWSFNSFGNGQEIAKFYLEKEMKPHFSPIQKEKITSKSNQIYDENLIKYEGEYYSPELKSTFEVRVENGKLIMSHSRLKDIELERIEEDKFTGVITFSVELDFEKNENEQITGFKISNFGAKNVEFDKLK